MRSLRKENFDWLDSQSRCLNYRRRILDISQSVGALHVAPAFSCIEIVDVIYNGLMNSPDGVNSADKFLMSKGHGCMAQYVVLEALGVLSKEHLESYNKPNGILGAHPDYGTPGIEASTGSLGHGVGMAVGLAYAEKLKRTDNKIFCIAGDGEMQEGSVWEAIMMAPNLGLNNLVLYVDFNNFQGLERTTVSHPYFLPLHEKIESFGWTTVEVNGHNANDIFSVTQHNLGNKPLLVVCNTVKGKGVSYMENVPIWHYRAPSPEEYKQALSELKEISS